MRMFLLACTSLLALSAAGTASAMPTTTFAYTGGFQSYTVPVTSLYDIVAFGAAGGSAPTFPTYIGEPPYFYFGGLGAEIGGDFELTVGEALSIAVGGAGSSTTGGGSGGGGSFVVGPGSTPLVIAGGGGGAIGEGDPGVSAQTGTAGSAGNFADGTEGKGGVDGGGGGAPVTDGNGGGAGGGGFHGSGSNSLGFSGPSTTFISGFGGGAFPSLVGGASSYSGLTGGFGGGGGGGGGGGVFFDGFETLGGGGGGGSYDGGLINADRVLTYGGGGNGLVTITELSAATSVPEPSSLFLFGAGLAGLLALQLRSRLQG